MVLNVSSTDGCQSMMKSVLDDLRPEPDWKCGKSFIFKASFIGNLFHQDKRWMENSVANFWGDWVQNIQRKHPDKWHNYSSALNRDNAPAHASLFCSSFWLLRIWQTSPTLPTHRTSPPVTFSYSRSWNWSSRGDVFWQLQRDTDRIAERDEDADVKWLPEVLPISWKWQRAPLRRGWGWIEILVSGKARAEEFREILFSISYISQNAVYV